MGSQRVGRAGATFTHSLRKTDFSLSDSAVAVCSSHGYPPQRCSFRHPLKYFLRRRLLCSRHVQLPNALAKRELPARKPREPSPHCSEADACFFTSRTLRGRSWACLVHSFRCIDVQAGQPRGAVLRSPDAPRGDPGMGASGRQVSPG